MDRLVLALGLDGIPRHNLRSYAARDNPVVHAMKFQRIVIWAEAKGEVSNLGCVKALNVPPMLSINSLQSFLSVQTIGV